MSSTEISKGFKKMNPGPLDAWYGPYADVNSACIAIPNVTLDGVKFRMGKIVGINTIDGIIEYWWNNGTNDGDLIEKSELKRNLADISIIGKNRKRKYLAYDADLKRLIVVGTDTTKISSAGDSQIFNINISGIDRLVNGLAGTFLDLSSVTIVGNMAFVFSRSLTVVTLSDIRLIDANSIGSNDVKIGHLTYGSGLTSRWIIDFKEWNDNETSLKNSSALLNDFSNLKVTHRKNKFLTYDPVSKKLIIVGSDASSPADEILLSLTYNGTVYTVKGFVGTEKLLTLTAGQSQIGFPANITDPANVRLTDFVVFNDTTGLIANFVKLAQVVYNDAINSNIIKDYRTFVFNQKDVDKAINNSLVYNSKIIWRKRKWLSYDRQNQKLIVVGSDASAPGDPQLLNFNYDGINYTLKGNVGTQKTFSGISGNAQFFIPKTVTPSDVNISDIVCFVDSTNRDSTHIKIGHLTYNDGLTSNMIIDYADYMARTSSVSNLAISKTGEADIFMKGKISTERDVTKVTYWGDSIFASGFKDNTFPDEFGLTKYEQPPRTAQLKGFVKQTYDYLNYNKPKFRNAKHADWVRTGATSITPTAVMPNSNAGGVGDVAEYDQVMLLAAGSAATAQLTISGSDKFVLIFEGGSIGDASQTGIVTIQVSVNGGAFVNPSTVLKGSVNKKGYGSSKVYDTAIDSFNTAFTNTTPLTAYNKYASIREVFYNTLNPANTYAFKVIKSASEPAVRMWGAYYSIGQTALMINQSKPGLSWLDLVAHIQSDLVESKTDYVIIEAPMYHDHSGIEIAKSNARTLINAIKSKVIQVALCSCPPGGVVITGRAVPALGDESSAAYFPGQNFAAYFNGNRIFNTTDLANTTEAPKRGDVYSAVIGGVTHTMVANIPTGYLSTTAPAFTTESNFPIDEAIPFPMTLNKVSGDSSSKPAIIVTGVKPHFTMAEHRTAVKAVAEELGCKFIDTYQAFVDVTNMVGEKIDSPAFDMDVNHPLYASVLALAGTTGFETLAPPFKMNYASNFFDAGDGHHLAYPAHDVIFQLIKNAVLAGSSLKGQ